MGHFQSKSDYHYQCIRTNVDLLNVIQIGLTIFNEKGEPVPAQRLPPQVESAIENSPGLRGYRNNNPQLPSTWQFNFKFSLKDDMYAESSINMLRSSGVDFEGLEVNGIDPFEFGAKLIDSGLVCDEDKHWVSFHGGYDFGYLTKILYPQPLPDDEVEFDRVMKLFFPSIWDVKYIMKDAVRLHQMGQLNPGQTPDENVELIIQKFEAQKSLESLGEALKIKRVGLAHQGGSDALHTGKCFFAMRERLFRGEISPELNGKVWGLATGPMYNGNSGYNVPQHSTPQHYHSQLQENTTPGQHSNGTSYANGTPSTPNNGHAGLAGTPAPSGNIANVGPLTPGGGGGVFGAFQYNSKQ
jgi:CCR4-NOT transcription complex subunit 7/8